MWTLIYIFIRFTYIVVLHSETLFELQPLNTLFKPRIWSYYCLQQLLQSNRNHMEATGSGHFLVISSLNGFSRDAGCRDTLVRPRKLYLYFGKYKNIYAANRIQNTHIESRIKVQYIKKTIYFVKRVTNECLN